ncbi:hypothetical protein PINS_up017494 [Pythium insidiosum]|nr:hypothetical protein PINS_up017494 [Pythium insidiosum]
MQAWPLGPDSTTIDTFRLLPWYSRYLPRDLEQNAPNNKAKIVSLAAGGRLFSADELGAFYATEPWVVLLDPPNPLSFDPDDARFKAVYVATTTLYAQHARALWDRTHFFIPADGPSRRELLAQRRRRNSSMSAAFKQHYRFLMDFVRDNSSFVDADLFMDPFFYWPPPIGVLLAFGEPGESVGACVARIDKAEPFRAYYARPSTRSRHPVSSCSSRVVGKFVRPSPHVPSAVSRPPAVTSVPSPNSSPVSPPGSPTSVVLDALRSRRGSQASSDADPNVGAGPCVQAMSMSGSADCDGSRRSDVTESGSPETPPATSA